MKDLARIKINEAERYMEDAVSRAEADDPFSPSVAIGHATDAMILAVDALCHEADEPPPHRHDDAPKAFLKLLRSQKIPEEASEWRDLILKAVNQRAAFQYHAEITSKSEARRFVQKMSSFVKYSRKLIEAASK